MRLLHFFWHCVIWVNLYNPHFPLQKRLIKQGTGHDGYLVTPIKIRCKTTIELDLKFRPIAKVNFDHLRGTCWLAFATQMSVTGSRRSRKWVKHLELLTF